MFCSILIVVKVTVGSKETVMLEFLFYQRNKYYFDSRELHEASIKELKLKEYSEFNTAWAPSAASVARCHFEGVKIIENFTLKWTGNMGLRLRRNTNILSDSSSRNKDFIIVYSPDCYFKPVWFSLFRRTQKKILWRMLLTSSGFASIQ